MLVRLLRMGIRTSNVQKKINKCKDEFYLHLVMRHCKVWNHDETEILESNPGSASSNIIFWFTQCNQSAKAPTSAKASIDQWGGLQNGSVRVSENDDFLFKNFLPFRAKVIWPAGLWKMNFLKKLTKKDSSNSLDQGSWNSFTELFVVNIVHNVWFHKCKKFLSKIESRAK